MTLAAIIIPNENNIKLNADEALNGCIISLAEGGSSLPCRHESRESFIRRFKEFGFSAYESEFTVIIDAGSVLKDTDRLPDGGCLFGRARSGIFSNNLISQFTELKRLLQKAGVFVKAEKDFTNFALSELLKNLNLAESEKEFNEYADALFDKGLYRLGILGHSAGYFYSKADYRRLADILKTPAEKRFDFVCREKAAQGTPMPYIDADALGCLLDESSSDTPKVSVIIPAYNVEAYIAQCLDCALSNTLRELDIICVDDGSTDSTPDILKKYAEKDSRITVLTKKNGGAASSRNYALPHAKGKYIHFLDSDDIIHPRTYEYLYSEAEKNNLDMLYFTSEAYYNDDEIRKSFSFNERIPVKNGVYSGVMSGRDMYITAVKNRTFSSCTCYQFIKREFLEKNRISFKEGIVYEDNLFNIQAMLLADRAAYSNIILYYHRIRNGSVVTSTKTAHRLYSLCTVLKEFEKFAQEQKFSESKELYGAYVLHCGRIAGQAYDAVNGISSESLRDIVRQLDDEAVYNAYKLLESVVSVRRSLEKAQAQADAYVLENARLKCINVELKEQLENEKMARKKEPESRKSSFFRSIKK